MRDITSTENADTIIRVFGGGLTQVSPPASNQRENMWANIISPKEAYPISNPRFRTTPSMLGKLESLARMRYRIGSLAKDVKLHGLLSKSRSNEINWEIAQSVNASCETEGEGISAAQLELALNTPTLPLNGDRNDDEFLKRHAAVREIYQAYIWALTQDSGSFISYDFVLELHRRMFQSTKPELAGCLKEKPIKIEGAGYSVDTLPPEKTRQFLRSLCQRTEKTLHAACKDADASMFITSAEFVIDFLAIHPFTDGNGRLARLLSTYLLERTGYHFARFYPLDKIIYEERERYYHVLFDSQQGWYTEHEDITSWIKFYIDAVYEQSQRAYRRVKARSNDSA